MTTSWAGFFCDLDAAWLCLEACNTAVKSLQSQVIPLNDFIHKLLAETSHKGVLGSKPIIARTYDKASKTFEDTFCNSRI